MEIERKYLIEHIPFSLDSYPMHQISQGYLSTHPVIRLRQTDQNYTLTYKSIGLLAREEYNLPLTASSYAHLIQKIDGLLICKKRYLIPFSSHTIELDIFEKELAPLKLAEVEFQTIQDANSFIPPNWFGKDVTLSADYQNSSLSQRDLK